MLPPSIIALCKPMESGLRNPASRLPRFIDPTDDPLIHRYGRLICTLVCGGSLFYGVYFQRDETDEYLRWQLGL